MVQNYYSLWYFITLPICDNKEDVSQNRIKSLIFFLKMVLFFNGLVLKIDSINLFHAIHHWKEESHSFPTVCGNLMENFFSYNTSGANRCVVLHGIIVSFSFSVFTFWLFLAVDVVFSCIFSVSQTGWIERPRTRSYPTQLLWAPNFLMACRARYQITRPSCTEKPRTSTGYFLVSVFNFFFPSKSKKIPLTYYTMISNIHPICEGGKVGTLVSISTVFYISFWAHISLGTCNTTVWPFACHGAMNKGHFLLCCQLVPIPAATSKA